MVSKQSAIPKTRPLEKKTPRFSEHTLQFLLKAARQKNPEWLDKNRSEYETVLLEPIKHLAQQTKASLGSQAVGYHFPQKGIGRLRRPAHRVEQGGGGLYRGWMTYSASRPHESRFESNPNLFFLLQPEDKDDPVLIAGGLYMPSSRQTRALREAIAQDASAFDRLFASKAFAARFPGGFSDERKATRPPRGFDPTHPRLEWLKLQGFFVWRSYTKREFASPQFAEIVTADWAQILRLNALLELALQGRLKSLPLNQKTKRNGKGGVELTHLSEIREITPRTMDF